MNSGYPKWAPYLLASPFVVVFAVFMVYPMLYSIVLAMQQTFGPKASEFVFLDNFKNLLTDPFFWKAMRNTFVFAAGSVFIQLPLSLGLAMLLNHEKVKGRVFFRMVFFSPALVGTVFIAVMFGLMFNKQGLINFTLHSLFPAFDPEFPWLERFVMGSLILAALWQYVGFNMVYFLAALQNVSRDLLEAAMVDGAGAWARFMNVTIPAIRPVASFVVLLSLIGSFQLFELAWVILNNSAGPNDQGLTVVMYLYQKGFVNFELGSASAIGWALAVLLMFFAVIQHRIARIGEEHG
ncbi:MAG: sugar ABC transporter permease [Phycisphaeraceae bacterium]